MYIYMVLYFKYRFKRVGRFQQYFVHIFLKVGEERRGLNRAFPRFLRVVAEHIYEKKPQFGSIKL